MMSGAHPFHITSISGAVLSDCRAHRYWLWRIWERGKPLLIVAMFNPSTADERKDDPTVQRLCGWARRWGYGGILIVNLHLIRSSDPAAVRWMQPGRSSGEAQHHALAHALDLAERQETPVLVAWGDLATDDDVRPFAEAAPGLDFICLGTNASGRPKHPMARGKARIPDDQEPVPYRLAI